MRLRGVHVRSTLPSSRSGSGDVLINARPHPVFFVSPQLQGSLRRKLEGHAPGPLPKQNGLSCGISGADFKRARLDRGGLGPPHGPCGHNFAQPQSLQGHPSSSSSSSSSASSMDSVLHRKSFMLPPGVDADTFNLTLKEMKQEPSEVASCGQSTADMIFDFKEEGGGQIDPELQDLFDELTKTVPSLNDLEFEKMLKQDDAFGLDLERTGSTGVGGGARRPLALLGDKPIKTEFSPTDYCHAHASSPQLRPASAGPSFTMTGGPLASASPSALGQKPPGGPPPRPMPCWPEVSHAEQLKQMAANQQQPNTLLHHQHPHPHHPRHQHHLQHHQNAPAGMAGWAPSVNPHSAAGPGFSQDKAPLNPQRMAGPQAKGINHCLFKANGHNGVGGGHLDMKVLSTKPTLHFSPKVATSPNAPMSVMTGALNKTSVQQQQQQQQQQPPPSTPGQNQNQHHYQTSQIPGPGSQCLQQKALPQHGPGLHFKLAQRQGISPGPRLPINGQSQAQQRPLVAIGQQKSPAKTPVLQRQLNQSLHPLGEADKDNPQDQFSRHLTRPPPDYKQTRSLGGGPPGTLFTGMNPSQSMSNGPDTGLPPMACHLPHNPGPKMNPAPGDRRFGVGGGGLPGPCLGPFQPQTNQHRMGLAGAANKPRLQRPGAQGSPFSMNGAPPSRPSLDQQAPAPGPGSGLAGLLSGVNAAWLPGMKQGQGQGVAPGLGGGGGGGGGVRRLTNPPPPHGTKLDGSSNHAYQQRHTGPPNQVAPDMGPLLAMNPALRNNLPPRTNQPIPGNPSQSSPEQRVPAGNFSGASPSPGTYQNNRVNRLTFDFLPEGDNTVPGINTDSDFIDSLLKSGSGNDDWMKDINLDEILGGHS
ncbi:LOW QUALITY PROTEIN: mastermind-like protein 2 [Gadus macrocephalus]|uniref:LOW QUALITY PROTEIN: mastermind-like protein 2 n=1 Tax=Gadus macrocephalus TaxID=80720 RepID=UPI0028CB888A|nr:LOW QUALITY PROTEIN: mastermind-like protein 2 [Gadus macrocephalus]